MYAMYTVDVNVITLSAITMFAIDYSINRDLFIKIRLKIPNQNQQYL